MNEAKNLGASYVIKARWDRELVPEDSEECESLLEALGAAPVIGKIEVEITGNGRRATRTAEVEVRFTRTAIKPPQRRGKAKPLKEFEPISINAISLTGVDPPEGVDAVNWVLLTDQPIRTLADAKKIVSWYTLRWQIEIYHKVMKSGCRVENCQLETADRLKRYLALMSDFLSHT